VLGMAALPDRCQCCDRRRAIGQNIAAPARGGVRKIRGKRPRGSARLFEALAYKRVLDGVDALLQMPVLLVDTFLMAL
jgi:hypothetical protein